eukprot:Sspe_Gene.17943::Locus_6414_Transcript_1_1_Confidence_1.000_Length_1294::g.17943::m.17943
MADRAYTKVLSKPPGHVSPGGSEVKGFIQLPEDDSLGTASGLSFPLKVGVWKIGRDPAADLHIPKSTISKEHASIQVTKSGQVFIEDNKSSNHTYMVQDEEGTDDDELEPLKPHKLYQLQDGAIVKLGQVRLSVQILSKSKAKAFAEKKGAKESGSLAVGEDEEKGDPEQTLVDADDDEEAPVTTKSMRSVKSADLLEDTAPPSPTKKLSLSPSPVKSEEEDELPPPSKRAMKAAAVEAAAKIAEDEDTEEGSDDGSMPPPPIPSRRQMLLEEKGKKASAVSSVENAVAPAPTPSTLSLTLSKKGESIKKDDKLVSESDWGSPPGVDVEEETPVKRKSSGEAKAKKENEEVDEEETPKAKPQAKRSTSAQPKKRGSNSSDKGKEKEEEKEKEKE